MDFEARVKDYYRHTENYDWTRAADVFLGLETIFHRARVRETVRLLNGLGRNASWIDVGCGTGLVTRHLRGRVVGIDLNPRNLDKARRYVPAAGLVLCDAEGAMPIRDRSFDVAVCTEMLEHLLHPERALAEVHRILKPGGRLVGSVPGRSIIWRCRGLSSSRAQFVEEPYHKHYRKAELEALLSERFDIVRLSATSLRMNWFFVASRKDPRR
jgi:ubiquinone/menaquinone biosynthesis C-methylase UbiE